MSWSHLLTDTADILRAPVVVNEFGQQTRDWDNPATVATIACSIQPATSTEDTVDRQTTRTEWRLYSQDPAAFTIEATDRISWAGSIFDVEVSSAMAPWRAGFGVPATDHHVELTLLAITG